MTAVAPDVVACANHPGREALGICVRCRTRICAECVTRVEGINYCVRCLEALAAERASVPPGAPEASRGSGLVWALSGLIVLTALTALVLEALLPG